MPRIISFPDVPGKEFEVGDDWNESDIAELYDEHRPSSSAFRQVIGDTAVALAKGVVALPQSIAGLADIVGGMTGAGSLSKAIEPVADFQETQKILGGLYSHEAKRAQKRVAAAEGVTETLKSVLKNPSMIQQVAGESLPSMLGGAGIAKKAIGYGLGRVAAAGLGEGAITAGQQAAEIRESQPDGQLTELQAYQAAVTGALTGAIGSFGNRIAGKLGIQDIDTLTSGTASEAVKRGIMARAVGGAIIESGEELLQSTQEKITSNVAQGKPWNEGIEQAGVLGGIVGGLMGGVAGLKPPSEGFVEPSALAKVQPPSLLDQTPEQLDADIEAALAEPTPERAVTPTPPAVAPTPAPIIQQPVAPAPPSPTPLTDQVMAEGDAVLGARAAEMALQAEEAERIAQTRADLEAEAARVIEQERQVIPREEVQAKEEERLLTKPETAAPVAAAPELTTEEKVELNELRMIREGRGGKLGRLNTERIAELESKEKGQPNALQEQISNAEVLRETRQELGLQRVVPQDTQQEVAPEQEKAEVVVQEFQDGFKLSGITVPKSQRGKGMGTAAVKSLIEKSNTTGKPIFTTASAESKELQPRLNKFYKRLGFKHYRDDPLSGKPMYRYDPPKVAAAEKPKEAVAKIKEEISAVGTTEGKRSAKAIKDDLVARLEAAIADAPTQASLRSVYPNREPDKVTFEIPGDGIFTVVNTKENLQELLKRAKRIGTTSFVEKPVSTRIDRGRPELKPYGTYPKETQGWLTRALVGLENKLKDSEQSGGQTLAVIIPGLDPATALAVWNTALRIAIGVLKATKNIQQAIQAGINFIKRELSKRNIALDADAEANLRSEFQSGITTPGPVREREKTGTSESALYQGGEYVLRNEKEDTVLANQFVDNRKGDLEQAYRDSKQISEISFRKVVQAEILARASVQWSKSGKFDPGLVRLMQSIGAEIKAMKSGAGQDLQAEKQVNQKLYQHMPVLSWLDILRQRHQSTIAKDLNGKETAIIEAAENAERTAKEAKEGKARVFTDVLDEQMRQQGVPPEVRKKVLKAAAKIIRSKPETPTELWDAIAKGWNLESMDDTTSQRLKRLSVEAQATPAGSRRNKVLQKMVDTLYDARGVNASEFLKDFWYANVLSSLRTFGDVLLGSGINGFTMAVRGALDAALVRQDPLQAVRILGQYFGGIAEGASNAIDIIKTGDYSRLPDAEARLMAMLDDPMTMRASALEAFKRAPQTWKKVLGQTAYVSRIMTGLDFVGGLGARDSMLVYSVLTKNDTDSLEALNRRFDKDANAQAEKQAQDELGKNAKRIDVLARKREILEEGISKDIRDNANDLGRLAALNVQPVGWLQPVVDFVGRWPFLAKTTLGLNFLRASVNMLQQAADWMPGIGLVSFGRARMTESAWFKNLPPKHPMRQFGLSVSPERRRLIAAAQIGGFGVTALAAAAVLGDDDDDDNLDISAGWKGISPNQRKQLMDSGERPYHIKLGKRWFSYKQTPFAAALAFVGTARDQKKFNKEKWDEQKFGENLVNAFIGGSLYFKDISALSSFANLIGVSASNTEDIDYQDVNRILAQSAMSMAGGMVPLASLQRDIDSWLDPQIYKANSGVDYWLRNIPFVRRTIGEGPVINAIGEPAIVGREPWSRWTIAENERPLYDVLRKKFHQGVFVPVAGATAQIVDAKTGERRRMTPIETYEYQKKSGKMMRQELEFNLKTLDKMTAKEFQEWIEQTQRKISVEARK